MTDVPDFEYIMAERREASGQGLEAMGQGPDGEDYVPFTNEETEMAWVDYDPKAGPKLCQCCGQPLPAS